jgi:hypothetical protein
VPSGVGLRGSDVILGSPPSFDVFGLHPDIDSSSISITVSIRCWRLSLKPNIHGRNISHGVSRVSTSTKAIEKEMKHVTPAFEILEPGQEALIGSKRIPCHMIFEVKMDFTRKAHFVAGGHWTAPPATLTYSSVVYRDSVHLAFLIAALNDLDMLAADIGNAYLDADTREKKHTTCGLEFGSLSG